MNTFDNYIDRYKQLNKIFKIELKNEIEFDNININNSFNSKISNKKYLKSKITKIYIEEQPYFEFKIINMDNKVRIYFKDMNVILEIEDMFEVTKNLVIKEKTQIKNNKKSLRYIFPESYIDIPIKNIKFELFEEKVSLSIEEYLEDCIKDILYNNKSPENFYFKFNFSDEEVEQIIENCIDVKGKIKW